VREQVYFTDVRIYVKGDKAQRGKAKKADYVLQAKYTDRNYRSQEKYFFSWSGDAAGFGLCRDFEFTQ